MKQRRNFIFSIEGEGPRCWQIGRFNTPEQAKVFAEGLANLPVMDVVGADGKTHKMVPVAVHYYIIDDVPEAMPEPESPGFWANMMSWIREAI